MQDGKSYLARVRGVELRPGERVRAILDADAGLVGEPPASGTVLVATDARLICAAAAPQGMATEMFALDTVSGARVTDERGQGLSWGQWLLLIGVGAAIYLALGYWLAERLPGPMLPVINMNAAALGLLILLLLIGGWIWRGTARSAVRRIRVTGAGWSTETAVRAPAADLVAFSTALLAVRQESAGGVRNAVNDAEPGGG